MDNNLPFTIIIEEPLLSHHFPNNTETNNQSTPRERVVYVFTFYPISSESKPQNLKASEKTLKYLPIINEKLKETLYSKNECCSVCLDDFTDSQVRCMPCQHIFHESCLFKWLYQNNTCPECRWELMTDNEKYNQIIKNKLPLLKVKSKFCSMSTINCCSEENEDQFYMTECQHWFHESCLNTNLAIKGYDLNNLSKFNCPFCRQYTSKVQIVNSN